MAFNVGAIVSKLTLDTKKWDASYKKVEGQADTLAAKIQRNSDKIKKIGKSMTIVGGAITATFGLMIRQTTIAGDTIDKMSKRTGIGAQSLSELGYAADLSGASLGDIERSMKRMSGTILDAKSGLETYARVFRGLGIEIDDLIKMKPEQQFMEIQSAIASIEDPTMRAALAQDVFGRAGTMLLPMMSEGVKGLEAMRKEARETGYIFTKETAAGAALLRDKMTKLTTSFKGATMNIAQALMPAVQGIIEKVTVVVQKVTNWIKENPKLAATIAKIAFVAGALLTVLGPMVILLPFIAKGIAMIGGAITKTMLPLTVILTAVVALSAAFKAMGKAADKAMARTMKAAKVEQSSINKVREYRRIAGKEDQDRIKRWLKMTRDQKIAHGEAMIMIERQLRKTSKAYREHAAQVDMNETATTDVVEEESGKRFKFNLDALNAVAKEKKKQVVTLAEIEKEITAAQEEKTVEDVERAGLFMEFVRQQMHERKMLGLDGMNAEIEQTRNAEIVERQSLKDRLGDTALYQEARKILAATTEKEIQAIKDKYGKEEKEKKKISLKDIADFTVKSLGIIENLYSKGYQNRMIQLNTEYEERKKWIEENITDETEREAALESLEDEFTQKKKEASRTAAIAAKMSALAGAIVNTSQAVTKAYAQGGLFGIVTGSIMAALGLIQINMIRKQPIPSAEVGGQVQKEGAVNLHPGEIITPFDKVEDIFGEAGGGSKTIQISIFTPDTKTMDDYARDHLIPYIQNSMEDEVLLVPAHAVKEGI